jgi:hypothetical protein
MSQLALQQTCRSQSRCRLAHRPAPCASNLAQLSACRLAGGPRTSTSPVPVLGTPARGAATSESQAAEDAGLAGSPLAYTSAGSLTLAEGAEAAGQFARFGSRGRSSSFRRSLERSAGAPERPAAAAPAPASAGEGHQGEETPEGALEAGSAPHPGAMHADGATNGVSPSVLRTVTERSESAAAHDVDAGRAELGTVIAGHKALNGGGEARAKEEACGDEPGAGADWHRDDLAAEDAAAASQKFSARRQVPLGKLAVLVVLFGGAARPRAVNQCAEQFVAFALQAASSVRHVWSDIDLSLLL